MENWTPEVPADDGWYWVAWQTATSALPPFPVERVGEVWHCGCGENSLALNAPGGRFIFSRRIAPPAFEVQQKGSA